MPLELSELILEEALRSYSSVKGHRTRVEKEIGLNDRLEKLEKHTHRLSDIAEYLVSLKYVKARYHRDKVANFKEVLDKCSEEVFTILPSGRFRYLRVPMGLSLSSDEWCWHSDRVVEGLPWCSKIVEDILIWASTPSELEFRISEVVKRCEVLSTSRF